jgi:hypothetical protein
MRLGYSRRTFVKAYPTQRQECFFDGHVGAFEFFDGVPHRLAYDNLKVAVYEILTGRQRQEQEAFTLFRSHYLFDSRYCTPGQGHEKGGVEHGVGYARRKFLVPLPQVASFEELNNYLLARCLAEDSRTVSGQPRSIGEMWAEEQSHLLPLPAHDLPCCVTREVALNPYCQVVFETNRYSVPADRAYPTLTLRAFPFAVEVLHGEEILARHPRCYEREQEIVDPLHYLPLLAQRPGAFEHPDAIRQFVQVLTLNREHDATLVEQAVEQALELGCAHYEGVQWCLNQSVCPPPSPMPLDLSDRPHLADIGRQPLDLSGYDHLLTGGPHGD